MKKENEKDIKIISSDFKNITREFMLKTGTVADKWAKKHKLSFEDGMILTLQAYLNLAINLMTEGQEKKFFETKDEMFLTHYSK